MLRRGKCGCNNFALRIAKMLINCKITQQFSRKRKIRNAVQTPPLCRCKLSWCRPDFWGAAAELTETRMSNGGDGRDANAALRSGPGSCWLLALTTGLEVSPCPWRHQRPRISAPPFGPIYMGPYLLGLAHGPCKARRRPRSLQGVQYGR